MVENTHDWVIILAAGEGQRVKALMVDPDGTQIPKQFCRLEGRTSMLRWTVDRALRLVPARRLVCVVAEQHQRWWERELFDLPTENVVVQPKNRGTAPGILLPLMTVLHRDPLARVLVLPSDHYVEHEETLRNAIHTALSAPKTMDDRVVLLGMVPDEFHSDYGWIVPKGAIQVDTVCGVRRFVEKPDSGRARRLMSRGALMNSLIFVGCGTAILDLFEQAVPALIEQFRAAPKLDGEGASVAIRQLYGQLPKNDFSRDVLEQTPDRLAVLPVPRCGWSDLGTPARLELYRNRRQSQPPSSVPGPPGSWFG